MPIVNDVDKLISDLQKIKTNISDAQAKVLVSRTHRIFRHHPDLVKRIENDIYIMRKKTGMTNVID
jgi:Zn-dependent protease with chaperone function